MDGEYVDCFNEILNSVTVSFRKTYGEEHNDVTRDVIIKRGDLENGQDYQTVFYPRLGVEGSDWLDYEYQLSWNIKGDNKTIKIPRGDKWMKANDAAIALTPPFTKRVVQIDADRTFFNEADIQACSVRFFTIVNGSPKPQRTVILRKGDAENSTAINLYHDKDEPVVYQITWYSTSGPMEMDATPLESDYMFLIPPQKS